MDHRCKCGDSFGLKKSLKRHLVRNTATCLRSFTEEELSQRGFSVGDIAAARAASRSAPQSSQQQPPLHTSAAAPPIAPTSPTTTASSPKRARTSSYNSDFDDDEDLGGFNQDGGDSGCEEGSGGEERLPSSPSASTSPAATSAPSCGSTGAAANKPVLLYDVVRNQRVDELLQCFDEEAPYKPVQVSCGCC